MESIVSSVKPEMNPAYFRAMGPEAGNQPPAPAHLMPHSSPAPK
jgi:hypothetical protein